MIQRWLRKQMFIVKDPDRILLYCALYGSMDVFGIIGTMVLFWNVLKKRRKEANASKGKKASAVPVR
jgi:hypothetical protein